MVEQQNIASFAISGLEIPLPERWYFHDEGASRLDILIPQSEGPQTIEGREFEIFIKHLTRYYLNVKGMSPVDASMTARKSVLYDYGFAQELMNSLHDDVSESGLCLKIGPWNFGNGDETHIHMLYLDRGRDDINVMIRAHEEQHALTHIPGAIEALEDKIKEDRGKPIHFNKIKDEELAADCNAVHALSVRGLDLSEVYSYFGKRDPSVAKRFKRARYIYETENYGYLDFATDQLKSAIKRMKRKK